jgi:ABC-type polysaccharide/polyol phosphate export permease
VTAVTEIWSYRRLIGNLAQRELRSRYKKSVLGWAWSLINPLATLAIYTVVFGVFLKVKPPVAGNGTTKSFGLYLFCALIMWNFFNGTVTGCIAALQGAGPLLKKVYFPAVCPGVAYTITVLFQTVVESSIMVLIMIVIDNGSWLFLLFPLVVVMMVMFSIGLGLVLSIWNVYFRDIGYLVGIAMNLLFYATPIIYPLTLVPVEKWGLPLRKIISANPLTQYVQMSRDLFYLHVLPSLGAFVYTFFASLLTLVVGYWLFNRRALNVSEEL